MRFARRKVIPRDDILVKIREMLDNSLLFPQPNGVAVTRRLPAGLKLVARNPEPQSAQIITDFIAAF